MIQAEPDPRVGGLDLGGGRTTGSRVGLQAVSCLALITLFLSAFYCVLHSSPALALSPSLEKLLASSKYVYISTERKDGSFGKAAEIWFMYHKGAVWVASPTTTWRVRRIRAGRTKARIAVGKKDGPSFLAKGSIVTDKELFQKLFTTYAKKYPKGWPQYEQRFREGLPSGARVLIKYQPID